MVITKEKRVHLTLDAPVNYVRPSADVLMISLAEIYGAKNVAVVLTGMGGDGALGIKAIKNKGGATIAQDEKTSVVYGMPRAAAQLNAAIEVLPLDGIAAAVVRHAGKRNNI